jgi:hypothetical protein
MFDITTGYHTDCEGFSRRDFIKVGALSAVGLTMADLFRMKAAGAADQGKVKSCIILWMAGGPSHMDTWDLKPEATSDVRGEFNPIKTNAPGVEISEHLPRVAQHADKFTIIRSITSPEGSHQRATNYMNTGNRDNPALLFPSYGSVIAKETGFGGAMPPYVGIPSMIRPPGGSSGYLSGMFNPFEADPNNGGVRDLRLPNNVSEERLNRRRSLLKTVDDLQKMAESDQLSTLDTFYQKAYDLVTSPQAKKAFNLSAELPAVHEAYGCNQPGAGAALGKGALLARRLVEAGVRFVTVSFGGWDTHGQNFNALKTRQLPPVDLAMSALLKDLHERGMLDTTLVLWMGEFGRTPKINGNAGRDHWPYAQSVVFAGGGTRGGQVIGKTNDRGEVPTEQPVKVEDMAASIYHVLGIDPEKEYRTPSGRPVRLVTGGTLISGLI